MKGIHLLACAVLFLSWSAVSADQDEPGVDVQRQFDELRSELRSQQERIKRLEGLLEGGQQGPSARRVPSRGAWLDLSNWGRVKPGMSRSQVEAILGKPTNVKVNAINYVTLFYQGEKAGVGYVSGNIQLSDEDRVNFSGINPPIM